VRGDNLCAPGGTTLIPDPNFEQALIGAWPALDVAPINGSVPTDNISGVGYFGSSSYTFAGITNLAGIECMISMQTFAFQGNNIANVNLSNNVLLHTLGLWGNQLTTLDLSVNVNLTLVRIDQNNLTDVYLGSVLDLSNLTTFWANNQTLPSGVDMKIHVGTAARVTQFNSLFSAGTINCDVGTKVCESPGVGCVVVT
jgi:hypothetical protein